jgi:hypothetical protein
MSGVVARRPAKRPVSWTGRIIRLAAVTAAAVVLGVSLYVALVKMDLLRGPFDPITSGDIALARSDRTGLRVLFVGNSLTAGNSMPALVHQLAEGDDGARPIFSVQYAAGNWTLRQASEDDGLTALLSEVHWDVVVLQENSRVASFSPYRPEDMYPFAQALDRKIAAVGARTVLFMTWGFRDGGFEDMQAHLAWGYSNLAAELDAALAPVGLAWAEARRRDPDVELWTSDGRHPSLSGSYLAACVFYALLSDRDPSRSQFTAGLEPSEARFLQDVAADVVAEYL